MSNAQSPGEIAVAAEQLVGQIPTLNATEAIGILTLMVRDLCQILEGQGVPTLVSPSGEAVTAIVIHHQVIGWGGPWCRQCKQPWVAAHTAVPSMQRDT